MDSNFNINRPKLSDEEINQHKDFDRLVKQFKERSLKQAQGDESWWKNKKVRYSAVIAGVTVICTVSYFTIFNQQSKTKNKNDNTITSSNIHQHQITKKPFIAAPSQKLKVPYSTYRVNNNNGGFITHSSSSKIKIPKNSFVHKNGKDVIGDVTIEYREFHDVGDIIVSGIPMAYDSSGTHYNLESAGMFDIKGTQNGEPVFIKPDKRIDIELASKNAADRFNQYVLDTLQRNWRYIQKDKLTLVADKKEQQVSASIVPEAQSQKLLSLKNQIEIVIPKKVDSVKAVFSHQTEQLPRYKEPLKPAQPTKGRPNFKLDGSYNEFPELAAFNNVLFEVGPENKSYSNDLHEITWSDVKMTQGPVKGKNYVLNLSYRNRSERLVVYPVLTGTDFDKAQKQYEAKFFEYEALIEKRKASEQRLLAEMQAKQEAYFSEIKKKQQEYALEKAQIQSKYELQQQNELTSSFKNLNNSARAMRLFSISQFGIFNSDCPHRLPEGKSVNPIFITEQNQKFIIPDYIFLVDHQTKSVYQLEAKSGLTINYTAGTDYSICVFSQNKIFMCGKKDFLNTVASGGNKFSITPIPRESENIADFKKALEI